MCAPVGQAVRSLRAAACTPRESWERRAPVRLRSRLRSALAWQAGQAVTRPTNAAWSDFHGLNLNWEAGGLTVTGLQTRPSPTPLHQAPVTSKRGTREGGVALHGTEAAALKSARGEQFSLVY